MAAQSKKAPPSFVVGRSQAKGGLFAIRGELDGEEEAEYIDYSQLIGLCVGEEEFLLAIEHVSEIVMLNAMTYVPQAPKHVEGVINLRGAILPVVSLRRMMDLPIQRPSAATRVIILRYEDTRIGIIVDSITYVVSLPPNEIETQGHGGRGVRSELIGGFAKREEKIHGVLDLTKIISVITDGRMLDVETEQAS